MVSSSPHHASAPDLAVSDRSSGVRASALALPPFAQLGVGVGVGCSTYFSSMSPTAMRATVMQASIGLATQHGAKGNAELAQIMQSHKKR